MTSRNFPRPSRRKCHERGHEAPLFGNCDTCQRYTSRVNAPRYRETKMRYRKRFDQELPRKIGRASGGRPVSAEGEAQLLVQLYGSQMRVAEAMMVRYGGKQLSWARTIARAVHGTVSEETADRIMTMARDVS